MLTEASISAKISLNWSPSRPKKIENWWEFMIFMDKKKQRHTSRSFGFCDVGSSVSSAGYKDEQRFEARRRPLQAPGYSSGRFSSDYLGQKLEKLLLERKEIWTYISYEQWGFLLQYRRATTNRTRHRLQGVSAQSRALIHPWHTPIPSLSH